MRHERLPHQLPNAPKLFNPLYFPNDPTLYVK